MLLQVLALSCFAQMFVGARITRQVLEELVEDLIPARLPFGDKSTF